MPELSVSLDGWILMTSIGSSDGWMVNTLLGAQS